MNIHMSPEIARDLMIWFWYLAVLAARKPVSNLLMTMFVLSVLIEQTNDEGRNCRYCRRVEDRIETWRRPGSSFDVVAQARWLLWCAVLVYANFGARDLHQLLQLLLHTTNHPLDIHRTFLQLGV